jgi:hypothetical protein
MYIIAILCMYEQEKTVYVGIRQLTGFTILRHHSILNPPMQQSKDLKSRLKSLLVQRPYLLASTSQSRINL